jgi:hypothetical protein
MDPIFDPAQLSHLRLKEFAVVAAWIATLVESANDLEDLLVDVPPTSASGPISARPSRGTSILSWSHSPSCNTRAKLVRRVSRSWQPPGWVRIPRTGPCSA